MITKADLEPVFLALLQDGLSIETQQESSYGYGGEYELVVKVSVIFTDSSGTQHPVCEDSFSLETS